MFLSCCGSTQTLVTSELEVSDLPVDLRYLFISVTPICDVNLYLGPIMLHHEQESHCANILCWMTQRPPLCNRIYYIEHLLQRMMLDKCVAIVHLIFFLNCSDFVIYDMVILNHTKCSISESITRTTKQQKASLKNSTRESGFKFWFRTCNPQ